MSELLEAIRNREVHIYPGDELGPPRMDEELGLVEIGRYLDVRAVYTAQHAGSISNREVSLPPSGVPAVSRAGRALESLMRDGPPMVSFLDGPTHEEARKILKASAFPAGGPDNPFEIAAQASLDNVLGPDSKYAQIIQEGRPVDIAQLIRDYVVGTFAQALGVDQDMPEDFQVERGLTGYPAWAIDKTAEKEAQSREAIMKLFVISTASEERWRNTTEEKQSNAHNYIVEALKRGHSQQEIMLSLMTLLTAGVDTTSYLIDNTVIRLIEKEKWEEAHANPDMLPNHIEETLAVRPPIHGWFKTVKEDIEIGGRQLHEGNKLILLLGAANRDPARGNKPIVSYGLGEHLCLGRDASKLITRKGLIAITNRIETISPIGKPDLHADLALNGLRRWPVEPTPANR